LDFHFAFKNSRSNLSEVSRALFATNTIMATKDAKKVEPVKSALELLEEDDEFEVLLFVV
jgi:hypothetical protein